VVNLLSESGMVMCDFINVIFVYKVISVIICVGKSFTSISCFKIIYG
jgi:hypothetical protein